MSENGGVEAERSAVASLSDGRRLTFVGGLHRSGTSLVHRCLSDHSDISGFEDTGVPQDEGQHLQSVYPTAAAFGGPGLFGLRDEAYLDENSPLASTAAAEQLLADWVGHWDTSRRVLVEKSPPNLIRTRFLQALFPASRFVIVTRHPIAASYATQKWTPGVRIHSLLEHWLLCHEQFERDRDRLRRVHVLRYEEFVASPQEQLDHIFEFLDLPSERLKRDVRSDVNDHYLSKWRRRRKSPFTRRYASRLARKLEARVQPFGYSLIEPI